MVLEIITLDILIQQTILGILIITGVLMEISLDKMGIVKGDPDCKINGINDLVMVRHLMVNPLTITMGILIVIGVT